MRKSPLNSWKQQAFRNRIIGKTRESKLPETPTSSTYSSRNESKHEYRYGLQIWKDPHLTFLSPFLPLQLSLQNSSCDSNSWNIVSQPGFHLMEKRWVCINGLRFCQSDLCYSPAQNPPREFHDLKIKWCLWHGSWYLLVMSWPQPKYNSPSCVEFRIPEPVYMVITLH